MFERFTTRARKVIVLAQEEALRLRHNFIGTEHLLLGLIAEDEGVAAQVLVSLNVTLDEAREQVEGIVGCGEEETSGQAPFTPRSKKVLELALRESLQLGHGYIGTEHLLLGLVRESEGVAARVLFNLDVDPDRIRREVVRRLGAEPESDPLDRVEAEMELESSRRRMSFRGRVGGIQVGTSSAGTLVVELDYAYEASEDPEGGLVTVNHDGLADLVEETLKEASPELPEQVAWAAGELLLRSVPEIREVTVVVSRPQVSGIGSISGFSVSGTFGR